MKKYLLALALLAPLFSFASSDNIAINPISVGCGEQNVTITGTATYLQPLRKVRVYLDDVVVYNRHHDHSNWNAGTFTLPVGTHTVKAQVRRLILGWVVVAQDTKTFTIEACPVIPDPIVCPEGQILEGETCVDVVVPPVVCEEGFVLEEDTCVPEIIPITCEEGYHLEGDACIIDELPPVEPEPPIIIPSTAPVTAVSSSGCQGYMSPCEYIRAYDPDTTCVWSEELRMRFAWDEAFRESILRPWRLVIFGNK
jgi:hypothetical protein